MTDIILSVLFVAALVAGIVLLYRSGCVRQAKSILLYLVTQAEKNSEAVRVRSNFRLWQMRCMINCRLRQNSLLVKKRLRL